MSEYASVRRDPFLAVLDEPEMEALFRKLAESGWALIDPMEIPIANIKEFVHQSERSETIIAFAEAGRNLGLIVTYVIHDEWSDDPPERHTVFEATHVSIERAIALLDVMGVVKVADGWIEMYRERTWR